MEKPPSNWNDASIVGRPSPLLPQTYYQKRKEKKTIHKFTTHIWETWLEMVWAPQVNNCPEFISKSFKANSWQIPSKDRIKPPKTSYFHGPDLTRCCFSLNLRSPSPYRSSHCEIKDEIFVARGLVTCQTSAINFWPEESF